MDVVYDQGGNDLGDMPGMLRMSACVGGRMTMELTPSLALQLVRAIEDAARPPAPERILIVDREIAPDAAGVWVACIMALLFVAALSPAARFIAGLL